MAPYCDDGCENCEYWTEAYGCEYQERTGEPLPAGEGEMARPKPLTRLFSRHKPYRGGLTEGEDHGD